MSNANEVYNRQPPESKPPKKFKLLNMAKGQGRALDLHERLIYSRLAYRNRLKNKGYGIRKLVGKCQISQCKCESALRHLMHVGLVSKQRSIYRAEQPPEGFFSVRRGLTFGEKKDHWSDYFSYVYIHYSPRPATTIGKRLNRRYQALPQIPEGDAFEIEAVSFDRVRIAKQENRRFDMVHCLRYWILRSFIDQYKDRKTTVCRLSNRRLQALWGASEKTVKRNLDLMKRAGLILYKGDRDGLQIAAHGTDHVLKTTTLFWTEPPETKKPTPPATSAIPEIGHSTFREALDAARARQVTTPNREPDGYAPDGTPVYL